jgi:DNA-binding CsgD family transcriptional regulator
MGYLFLLQDKLEEAAKYYEQSLEISRRLEDIFGIAQVFDNLGELAHLKGQFELALQQKQQALEFYEEISDRFSAGAARREMATSWIKLKRYDLALPSLRSAEQTFLEIDSPTSLSLVYKSYYELYKALDQPEQALQAFEKYRIINDSLNTVAKTRQLEELQLIYRVEQKDQEIAMLAKDVELGQLRRRLLGIGLLASLLIGALIIYMQIIRRKKERKIEEERRLRQATELEKNRLEKEQLERELASQVLQLCRKNELLTSLQQDVSQMKSKSSEFNKSGLQRMERTIQSDIQSDEDWRQFLATFEKVHPDFLSLLRRQAQKLSPAEQRLSCLFKMNLSSKEIATLLNITDEGVKKARYRLRKKLDLSSDVNLQEYLIHFPDKILNN